MKIYIAHSTKFNFKDGLYTPIKNSRLYREHEVMLPHDNHSFFNSREYITNCDVVITEVSYPSTGMGIELGLASYTSTPIICIYKKKTKPSRSLKEISKTFIEYQDSDDLITRLEVALDKFNR